MPTGSLHYPLCYFIQLRSKPSIYSRVYRIPAVASLASGPSLRFNEISGGTAVPDRIPLSPNGKCIIDSQFIEGNTGRL